MARGKEIDLVSRWGYDPKKDSDDAVPPNPLIPVTIARPCSVVRPNGAPCSAPGAWTDVIDNSTYCITHASFINDLPASRSARWAQLELVAGHLAGLSAQAVLVLGDLLADPDTPSAVKLKAATEVLDRVGLGKSSTLVVSNGEDESGSVSSDTVRLRLEKLAASQNVIPLRPKDATDTEEVS